MTNTIRIQRSRQHKQVSPNGRPIIYVGRPSKWGNPFKVIGDMIYINAAHRRKVLDPWVYFCPGETKKCVELYRLVLIGRQANCNLETEDLAYCAGNLDAQHWLKYFRTQANFETIKHRNLSCWCKIGEPCHADVLLELVAGSYFETILNKNKP